MGWDATTLRLVTKSLILVYITDTVFSTSAKTYIYLFTPYNMTMYSGRLWWVCYRAHLVSISALDTATFYTNKESIFTQIVNYEALYSLIRKAVVYKTHRSH